MTSGFIYFSDDHRHGSYIEERGRLTDVVPSQPPVAALQIALVALDSGSIHFAAVARRGRKAASLKWLVTFEAFEQFDPPIEISGLISRLDLDVGARLGAATGSKGLQVSGDDWSQVGLAIDSMQSEVSLGSKGQALDSRRPRARHIESEPIIEYEHDAIGMALEMAGIDRKPVLDRWSGSDTAPFLSGLDEFKLLEDNMINFDTTVFGDWVRESSSLAGLATFRQGGRTLNVLNVNRTEVEHSLGVDLVYYNHQFDAYVLVQYKRMLKATGGGHEYRPDPQLKKELKRMRALGRTGQVAAAPSEYRLDDSGMYLKLCPSTALSLNSADLIRGMYLPLEYWDLALDSNLTRGKRGGRLVRFDNIERHMTNTLFQDLVSSGWIGSRGLTTAKVTEIVRASLSANKSVILAEGGPTQELSAAPIRSEWPEPF